MDWAVFILQFSITSHNIGDIIQILLIKQWYSAMRHIYIQYIRERHSITYVNAVNVITAAGMDTATHDLIDYVGYTSLFKTFASQRVVF